MLRCVVVVVTAAIATPAMAQQPPPDPVVQDVVADWTAESRARDHSLVSLQKLLATYQKVEAERARLAAEVEDWKNYAKPLYETIR